MLKYETPELHFARCATVTYNVSQIAYLVVLLCTSIFKSEPIPFVRSMYFREVSSLNQFNVMNN